MRGPTTHIYLYTHTYIVGIYIFAFTSWPRSKVSKHRIKSYEAGKKLCDIAKSAQVLPWQALQNMSQHCKKKKIHQMLHNLLVLFCVQVRVIFSLCQSTTQRHNQHRMFLRSLCASCSNRKFFASTYPFVDPEEAEWKQHWILFSRRVIWAR